MVDTREIHFRDGYEHGFKAGLAAAVKRVKEIHDGMLDSLGMDTTGCAAIVWAVMRDLQALIEEKP